MTQPLDRHSNYVERGLVTKPVHPLALLIPEMAPDQFEELRADIAAHGLHEAIVLHEDMILDGRHRMRACIETDTEPRFVLFEGESPAEFVLSMNVKRRHLTPSQRAAIAVEFLPAIEDEKHAHKIAAARAQQQSDGRFGPVSDPRITNGAEPIGPRDPGHKAREDAGALVGVSGASVDRAQRVKREDPEMFEQVKAGTLPVRKADTMLRERNKSATRDGHKRREPIDLVENVIDKVRGTVVALDVIDLDLAITTEGAPLTKWDKTLTDIIVPLYRLRGEIRKVLDNE